MQVLLLALNGLIMIVTPLIVATAIARRYHSDWGLFGAGAITFVVAQVLHIPFNRFVEGRFLPAVEPQFSLNLVFVALFYGLSAGVFEEAARYVTFRYWRKDARRWAEGLMVGAGHGGIEALILGLLFLTNMTILLGANQGYFTALVPAEVRPTLTQQAETLLALPWYETLLGGVERLFAVTLHLGLSLMVLRSVQRRTLGWLLLAVLWHAAFNAVALIVAALSSAVVVEAVLGVFALGSLALIWRWRETQAVEKVQPRPPPERPALEAKAADLEQKLSESRYLD